jgi:hypothetical protein
MMAPPNEKAMQQIQKFELEETLRGEFEATLPDRVRRYLEVKPHGIISYEHFSAASTECALLFRDGHFYGSIAMAQAVAEARVRFMCERRALTPSTHFERNLNTLRSKGFMPDAVNKRLPQIWSGRDDYHHLNPTIEQDRQQLERLAREKVKLLAEVEAEVFGYSVADGKLVPTFPEYWNLTGNQAQVFLRLE